MEEGLTPQTALSPLDGRYSTQVQPLRHFYSEFALNRYRIEAEVKYLLFFLSRFEAQALSPKVEKFLLGIHENFNLEEAKNLKKIEETTKHDVKAVEYYIREKLEAEKIELTQWVHFGLTSEDVNSLAQGLALKAAVQEVIVPELTLVVKALREVIADTKNQVMLARTHGQPAVPTLLGKELAVFAIRLQREVLALKKLPVEAKVSGAVGNFNALALAYPQLDLLTISREFITSLGLKANDFSTQILPAESYCHIFQRLQSINTILLDLDQDMWRYISDSYFSQPVKQGEIGSSTMPQKVNPIHFENSEGNLGLANALLAHFCAKLPISRLQRDLSDSTVKRNFGVALGYGLLGYQSCRKGLSRIRVNSQVMEADLNQHWEVVTEGIQTLLRQSGDTQAYEKMKELAQGKRITQDSIKGWAQNANLSGEVAEKILQLSPLSYTGRANEIVELALKELDEN